MRITKTEEYGVRVVIRLAAEGGQMTVAELAQKEGLPEPTVGKLLNRLKSTRLVDSVRGRGGGFELTRTPGQITVADVLAALGQPALGGNACTDGGEEPGRCPHLGRCNLRPVWSHLEGLISEVFGSTTIANLLEQERRVRQHLSNVTGARGPRGAPRPAEQSAAGEPRNTVNGASGGGAVAGTAGAAQG